MSSRIVPQTSGAVAKEDNSLATEFIDAYAHCGLSKYKPLPGVEQAMRRANVDRAVLVQHLGEFDNHYLEQVVAANPEKFAGVFLVNSDSPQALEDLARWAETGTFRGVRLVLESLESRRPIWRRAAELKLNLVVFVPHDIAQGLDLLEGFIQEHPSTKIILSHFGLGLEIQEEGFACQRPVYQLAEYGNVYFQVSGMHMFCEYPFDSMRDLVSQALTSFGPKRMLWGGNYPVVGTDEDYAREADFMRAGGFDIPPAAVVKIACDTAKTVWF